MFAGIKRKTGLILTTIILIAFILLIYFILVHKGFENKIDKINGDIAEIDNEIELEIQKSKNISEMEEIICLAEKKGSKACEYNNERSELEFLSELMGAAVKYDISFSEPVIFDNDYVRRRVSLNYSSDSYTDAVKLLKEIINSPYKTLVDSFQISPSGSGTSSDLTGSSLSGNCPVSVSVELIFLEYLTENTDRKGLE